MCSSDLPTPALLAEMNEARERLLAMLHDAELRALALAKLEGCTNEECAERLKISPRTVDRKLKIIRKTWDDVRS